MKITFQIHKLANLYSFISNLSQWNELTCVAIRKKEWLKKTVRLTQREKEALKKFSDIFINAKGNPELIFLFKEPKEIWVELEKSIGEKKTKELQQIFILLELRFNKLWQTEKKKLKIISQLFKNKKKEINKNLKLIGHLCGLTPNQIAKEINLHLLLSSSGEEAQGWSWNSKIILECSGWPPKKIDYLINCIFLHEVFHLLIKKNKGLFNQILIRCKKIKKWLPKNLQLWQAKIIAEDILVSSFLPEGYLAEKLCGLDVQKEGQKELGKKTNDSFTKLRFFCALKLYDLAKNYQEGGKSLDGPYLRQVMECIKKFKQK